MRSARFAVAFVAVMISPAVGAAAETPTVTPSASEPTALAPRNERKEEPNTEPAKGWDYTFPMLATDFLLTGDRMKSKAV